MTDDAALAAFARLLEEDFVGVVEGLRDRGGKIVLNADDLFRLSEAYRNEPAARMRLGPILYTPLGALPTAPTSFFFRGHTEGMTWSFSLQEEQRRGRAARCERSTSGRKWISSSTPRSPRPNER